MLRAQVSQKPARSADVGPSTSAEAIDAVEAEAIVLDVDGVVEEATTPAKAAPKRRTTRKSTAADADARSAPESAESAAPKRQTTRKSTTSAADGETPEAAGPKPRTTRSKTATAKATTSADAAAGDGTQEGDAAEAATPKRRTTRKTTKTAS